MISIDISLFVSLYLVAVILVFLVFFLKQRYPSDEDFPKLKEKFSWKCDICTYVYFSGIDARLSKCPICGSINKRK